jgi:sugar O-acyltransferase (sialic acid O-acetyltransferase NeuD family)
MRKPIVIFGAGDIAQLAHFYFVEDTDRKIAAFTVDGAYLKENEFCGLPIVAFETVEQEFPPDNFDMFVALSYRGINRLRAEKCTAARQKGYTLSSYVSSRATVLTKHPIGDNAFLLEDNTIQPFVKIGNNVTLWSGNHIGHHSIIEDDCFIASHVVISGGVVIGQGTFVGVNATVRDHVSIGTRSVIGAGALVLEDTGNEAVYGAQGTAKAKVPSSRLRSI